MAFMLIVPLCTLIAYFLAKVLILHIGIFDPVPSEIGLPEFAFMFGSAVLGLVGGVFIGARFYKLVHGNRG